MPTVDMNMPILLVDEYMTMLRIMKNLLIQLGFKEIDLATDGAEALVKMRAKPYSLVLSDWNMEPMTGLQLLQEVRADEKLKDTKFILVTAVQKTADILAAKEAGVSNYIVKPFNAEMLKGKLRAVLGEF